MLKRKNEIYLSKELNYFNSTYTVIIISIYTKKKYSN